MDSFFHLFLAAMTGIFLVRLVKEMRTERVVQGRIAYERSEQPIEFWSVQVYHVIGVAVLLWLLATRDQASNGARLLPVLLLFSLALPAAFWFVRGLQTGLVRFRGTLFGRREEPIQYWLMLAIYFAGIVLLGVAAVQWKPREEPSYEQMIAPVVRAVRLQLPGDSPPFRNVGIDRRSGIVCGEVMLGDRVRRFYGDASKGEGRVVLEHEGISFRPAYQRYCGGGLVVPS